MKRRFFLLIAGLITAIIFGLTMAIPVLLMPSFILYFAVIMIALVVYDYTRPHHPYT